MENIRQLLHKWGKSIGISIFLFLVFLSGTFTVGNTKFQKTQVLGVSTHNTSSPTVTPVPTVAPITIINNIILPSQMPTLTPQPTAAPTPLIVVVTPTPTPVVSPTPVPTVIPSPTPTPTPVPQTVTVDVTYAGEQADSTYTTAITANEAAWQAVQDAVGLANIKYTDYGGSLGIFITEFNGVAASQNQYYDFQVNGVSSSVGVSSYTVRSGDVLKFVLTNS